MNDTRTQNEPRDSAPFAKPRAKAKDLAAFAIDLLSAPLTFPAALWLRLVRSIGIERRPFSRAIFNGVGVFPVRDHFYEPLFAPRQLSHPLNTIRNLTGLDWNVEEQLSILGKFHYGDEISRFPRDPADKRAVFAANSSFSSGDPEYLYAIIRCFKPGRIIEVGSGRSTLISLAAVRQNSAEDGKYDCKLTCIEPYLQPWLEEESGVEVERKRVEDVDLQTFKQLTANDVLFIDSSHIIRPQGDVNFLFLEVLPLLSSGVLVHVHDIFTPDDYPYDWCFKLLKLYNEQYLLEAFLAFNQEFRIIGSLKYLHQNHFDVLREKFPTFRKEATPSSFWMVRR